MKEATAYDLLSGRAASRPGAPALIEAASGRTLSYAELDGLARRASSLLRSSGVRPGDRVLLVLPNVPEFFALLLGALRTGAVAVPIDPRLAEAEVRRIAAHCEPRFQARDASTLARALADAPEDDLPAHADAGSLALILYTSGTTGRPKGAALTHSAVLAKLDAVAKRFALGESDRALCLLPVCFGHALLANCLPALRYGGAVVLDEPFSMAAAARLPASIQIRGATTFSCVPGMLRALLDFRTHLDAGAFKKLRFVTCASAPLAPELARAFEETFGPRVHDCYGLTETASWIAVDGEPLACELRVDADGGVLVRGPAVMREYYGEPELTAAALRDGWLATGDVGRLEDGRLRLLGRSKELIIRNGLNIYPDELDAVLARHPAVAEAATVGAPDPLLGEIAVSFVALRAGAAATAPQLLAHCREHLAAYKCPERIRLVAELPRTPRGKIDKKRLIAE